MNEPSREALLETACAAARAAGQALVARYEQPRVIEHKGPIDLVTDADRAAEDAALAVIRSRFPEHAILAEESGDSGASSHRWILDPLDGTTNYAHRIPHFAVSIACEVDGALVAGAILEPLRGELFTATRGGGAFLGAQQLAVSQARSLDETVAATGFPYWVRERPDALVELFARVLEEVQGVRRFGSAALDLAYVACGRYDAFFERGLKAWDLAAGALIVEEAGGVVTNLTGEKLELAGGDVLAAAPGVHEALRRLTAPYA